MVLEDGYWLPECPAPYVMCAGRCVDPRHSAANCGGCGVRCPSGQVCDDSLCGCPQFYEACDGGCVALSGSDPLNCGGCNLRCGGGYPRCVQGQCVR